MIVGRPDHLNIFPRLIATTSHITAISVIVFALSLLYRFINRSVRAGTLCSAESLLYEATNPRPSRNQKLGRGDDFTI